MASHVMTKADRMCLHSAARDLHIQFRGIFGEETIESLLFDSYAELSNRAIAWSGGSEPVSGINPGVIAALDEARPC